MARRDRCAAAFFAAALLPGCFLFHGHDAAPGPVPVADAGVPLVDAAVPPPPPSMTVPEPRDVCAPMAAATDFCGPDCESGAPRFVFDGYRCVHTDACRCAGADCARAWTTLDACLAATDACDSVMCRATGGYWLPELEYCGPHECSGLPAPRICESPGPACNCGVQRYFVPGEGCILEDELCEPTDEEQRCVASGGLWGCDGDPSPSCICECARGRRFEPDFGCVPDWPDDCGERFCPLPDGAPCDPRAPACGDEEICCGWGRIGPSCGSPICDSPFGDGPCVAIE